jgi:hypothetical protein
VREIESARRIAQHKEMQHIMLTLTIFDKQAQ